MRTGKNRDSEMNNNYMSSNVVKKFIEAYKKEPSLWKTKSKEYTDRNLKKDAYNKIVSILKDEGIQDATKEFVVRKINVLRCCWRKEYNKVLRTHSKYKPNLWYYNLLKFIVDENDCSRNTYSSYNSCDDLVKTDPAKESYKNTENEKTERYSNSDENQIEIIWEKDSEKDFRNSSNCNNNDITEFIETPRNNYSPIKERSDKICILQHNNNDLQTISKCNSDEYDAFGFIVASKLRKISAKDELQQLFCENIINTALLGASLGKLTEQSNITF